MQRVRQIRVDKHSNGQRNNEKVCYSTSNWSDQRLDMFVALIKINHQERANEFNIIRSAARVVKYPQDKIPSNLSTLPLVPVRSHVSLTVTRWATTAAIRDTTSSCSTEQTCCYQHQTRRVRPFVELSLD